MKLLQVADPAVGALVVVETMVGGLGLGMYTSTGLSMTAVD